MGEFEFINRHFAPLSGAEGLGLKDDAALFSPMAGMQTVITTDSLTAGIHFFAADNPKLIAQKALRVNLSDLAAKGAIAAGYFLNLLLPKENNNINEAWISEFCKGLAEDQNHYNITLMGGDTSQINGPLTLSITAIGQVPDGTMLRRDGAEYDDDIYVSGKLGNSALGLMLLHNKIYTDEPIKKALTDAYYLPQPRHLLGIKLRELNYATSSMDISDGLLQDAGHLAAASKVGFSLAKEQIPISEAASYLIKNNASLFEKIITGGDDYEILFTANKAHREPIKLLANELKISLTMIGKVTQGNGVRLLDHQGKEITIAQKGWQHF